MIGHNRLPFVFKDPRLDFVSQMPDGSLRDKATAAACEAWTKTDPAAAAAWVHSQPDSPGRQDALNQTATAWARKDAASAAAWASAAPEGPLPGNAYSSIMDFLRRDRAAAYAGLNELPPDAARAAAPRLVGSTDLAGAHAAFDLPDGPYKPLVLDHVLNRFIRSDTQLAIVQATTFTPDQRALLRSLVEAAEPVPTETYRNSLTGAEKAALLERLR